MKKKIISIFIILFILGMGISFFIHYNQPKEVSLLDKPRRLEIFSTQDITNIIPVAVHKPKMESKITDWNLILVNKDHKIPKNYECKLQIVENNHQVDARIVEPLRQMLTDARKEGLKPFICSSYRTNSTQISLYNRKVNQFKQMGYSQKEAEEQASYWVTLPGTSEHELGLSVDIVEKNYQVLDKRQENTDVQKWLMEHCIDYGFILRYPTSKKETTKINYEPWHYRYVGRENAKWMKEKEICLEEYIEYLEQLETTPLV